MNIINVVGARPNLMKIAPIMKACKASGVIESLLVHTGQHYDEKMNDLFFTELGIPEPNVNLEVGSASHAIQTAEIMKAFEPVVLEYRPDAVLVVADILGEGCAHGFRRHPGGNHHSQGTLYHAS